MLVRPGGLTRTILNFFPRQHRGAQLTCMAELGDPYAHEAIVPGYRRYRRGGEGW